MAGPTTAERGARQKPESGSLRPPRAARLFRLRMLIILFLVVMAAGGSVWLLYGSSWLRLTRVSVSGTRVMTDAQVREAAGVRLGTPLISLDTDEIEARLRRELPRIDSVEVVRSGPHGIGLNVTERTPVLILASGGKFIEVESGAATRGSKTRAQGGRSLSAQRTAGKGTTEVDTAALNRLLAALESMKDGNFRRRKFQKRSEKRIRELREEAGTVFLVSHNNKSIRDTCDRVLWLERGELRMDGPTAEVLKEYEKFTGK
ncbi:FtsQ-type POTRA domain-containing protein [Streptomyces sp. NPDC004290]